MNEKEYYDYLISAGFAADEAERRVKDKEIMNALYKKPKEPREITSSAYIRADKRVSKEIQNFLGW